MKTIKKKGSFFCLSRYLVLFAVFFSRDSPAVSFLLFPVRQTFFFSAEGPEGHRMRQLPPRSRKSFPVRFLPESADAGLYREAGLPAARRRSGRGSCGPILILPAIRPSLPAGRCFFARIPFQVPSGPQDSSSSDSSLLIP